MVSRLSYNLKDWQQGYKSQPKEYNYWIDDIEGEIPDDLQGTLFRNGPGLLDIQGQRFHHPFDGDGMVCAIRFKAGRAHFCNRFVKTEGYLAEQKAGKILYRGVFGTQKPGGWLANLFDLKIKNIANTNVIYWGGKLLALWEAAPPYQLDPFTLETLGLDHLEGILQTSEPFAAHPRIAKGKNHQEDVLVNFSVKINLSSVITIYEFDAKGNLFKQHDHAVPGFAFLHDMAITPNYCIFFQNPVVFNPLPYLFGWRSAAQCIEFCPEKPTQAILIPRNPVDSLVKGSGTDDVQIIQTKSCFVFHHANAWEQGDEIYLDSICYESFPSVDPQADFRNIKFDTLPEGQLWRFKIDLKQETIRHQVLERRCCEFPTLHPTKVGYAYRYLYLGAADMGEGNAPLQAILKIDQVTGERQLWSAAPRGFVGEPVFVPRQGGAAEDDGWLLTLVYDAACHRTDVVILDARNLQQEPVARLHLKHHVPYGLHGCFTPDWFEPNG